jgi:hypothetical protein
MAGEAATTVAATSTWLTPTVFVSAVTVLVASVIIPLLLHWLKGRRERADKIFDIRKEAYTKYFEKYEKASEDVGQDYEEFSQVTLKEEFLKLLRSDTSPEAIVEFSNAVGNIPEKIQSSYRKATEEITSVKIIGSEKLLELVKEFEKTNKEILEMSSKWIAEMQGTFTMPDFESPIAKEMTEKGIHVQELKEQIIEQMRKELGTDKR